MSELRSLTHFVCEGLFFLQFSDIESVSDEDMLDDYEEEEEAGKGNDSDFSEDTPFAVRPRLID